ncbi:hypothetical protein HaLaN_29624 [Haematococcus lacustris]|uniref:S1 motif domain-containing protein n=1 Tax=Haematococcus lacustris TaxID=44745 RepID=A0A6A0AEI5_HAELA|nr:hypothetical protein HaLaN_29624 [Haematococcus lacustris]
MYTHTFFQQPPAAGAVAGYVQYNVVQARCNTTNRLFTPRTLRRPVSTPFLRPLICYAAAEPTPEAATTSVKAVVVSATNDRSIQVSTKALELVPGQMKTDKQAVFANAAEGLAQYLVSKKEIMDQRQQALTQLQVGTVVTGTAKLRRKDGWLVELDGVAAQVHRSNLDDNLERGQSVQILITGINEQSAVALATARFEKKPDGTYQPLPRLRAKLTETKAAAKPAVEPASKA